MSNEASRAVWKHSEQTGSHLMVMLAIADYAQSDGTGAYPGVPALARKCRLSVTMIRTILKDLAAAGEIAPRPGVRADDHGEYDVVYLDITPRIMNGETAGPQRKTRAKNGEGKGFSLPEKTRVSAKKTRISRNTQPDDNTDSAEVKYGFSESEIRVSPDANTGFPYTSIDTSENPSPEEFAADAAPPPPAVVSPPANPSSKPARARKETPEQTTWFSTLVPVVVRVCGLDLNVAGAYAQCKKALQAIEHAKTPPTEALLVELFEAPTGYWFSNFPGNRDGLPPKPHQIPNEWARALAWRPMPYANGNGHQARAAPTKQERTLAALDEYLAEQGYEPPPVVPGVIEGRVIRGNTS